MILSRFFKPKWQHPDPQIRKLAVQSLSHSDPALAQVAKEDQNPAVRRAALYRINDLKLLLQIAREDSEVGVRETAEAHFRKLMTGKETDSPALESRLAILQQAASPGLAAFLAVQAAEPELRLAALPCVADQAILGDIAVKDPVADVRFAALELVHEASVLAHIAKHTLNRDKRVNRGARERLDTVRREQARKDHSERLCARLEALAEHETTKVNIGHFRTLETEWEKQGQLADRELLERFQNARARFLERIRETEARHAERLKLCETLEHISKKLQTETELLPDFAAQIEENLQNAQQAWNSLGPADNAEQADLARRLQTIKDQERLLHRNHERAERLREVLREADELLHQASEVRDKDLTDLKKRWSSLERPETETLLVELQLQFDAALSRLQARLRRQVEQRDQELAEIKSLLHDLEAALAEGALQQAIALQEQARQRLKHNIGLSRSEMASLQKKLQSNLPRINELRGWRRWGTGQAREHLCEEAESLIGADEDPTFIAQQVKQLRATWKSLDGIEEAASKVLWDRFNGACERAYEPCQAYFDSQAQERQANLERKQAVCERLEAFEADTDWETVDWRAADRIRRDAHNQWRKIGPVSRAARRDIEKRYRRVLRRLDAHLDKERRNDLERRTALIRRVQALADNEDLRTAMSEAKKAQTEWQPTVLASRREEQALWKEFRAACDAIFERRHAERQAADAERQANLARKIALCEELEGLLASGAVETVAQVRAHIQETAREWDTIGPLPKAAHQDTEQRFAAARARLEQQLRDKQQAQERQAMQALRDKAELCARIEALLFAEAPGDTDSLLKEADASWEALPPLKPPLEESIRQRFEAACRALAAGGEARQSLLETLERSLDAKKTLCLRMEIMAGVETPPELAQARMEYQVSRLSESLTNRDSGRSGEKTADEVRRIEQEWYLAGCQPSEPNNMLEARFERALAAFQGRQEMPGAQSSVAD